MSSQRFALVMVLSLATVLVSIAMPPGDITRAVALLLQGSALIVALVAAHGHEHLRRRTGFLLAPLLLTACALTAFGVIDDGARAGVSFAIALATPAVMVHGLIRLLRERGVVAQAVFGALALYLQIGLIFAFGAGAIGAIQETQFFGGDTRATTSEFVYFSFTTMSTTGYGDLTPATSLGRSLAVLEMLIGQIYLVTIVGLLVGNIGRPHRPAD
jgi:hypothetical protein